MLNRPTLSVRHMEPQRPYHHNNQGRHEEHYRNTEQNQRAGRPDCLRRNNNPYSDEEEYPSNDRYNPRGGHLYDNRCTTNNRGGQAEPRS